MRTPQHNSGLNTPAVADAAPGNWVDRRAPQAWRPYLRLARADRPVGAWLLLFPCWWSQALAELSLGRAYPNLWYALLFAIGAFVMRGAGCVYNDIVDRDYDAGVARTRNRPIPSGQVTVAAAKVFMVALCLIGLAVLLQFNGFAVLLGVASLGLVAIYPFMKRFTYWPQLVLGLTFKWGALVGWAAVTGSLAWPALLLYAGCVFWTIGYDTIYAHQDKEDDEVLGLKSTALRFGNDTKPWLTAFYGAAIVLWALAGSLAGAGLIAAAALAATATHLVWQIRTLDISDPQNCLVRFRSNCTVGWLLVVGLVAFYGGSVILWGGAGYLAGAGFIAAAALAATATHLVWQIRTLDISDPQNCLVRFRSNCTVGWLLVAGLVAEMAWGAVTGGG